MGHKIVVVATAVAFAILAIIAANMGPARGHSFYDPWCCNAGDCSELATARQANGKWYYKNKLGNEAPVIQGYTRLLPSPDGKTHACVWAEDPEKRRYKLRCLYIPGGN